MALQMKRKNILFVGAPGSGKGTYSRIISPILMVSLIVEIEYLDTYFWIRRLYEKGDIIENFFWKAS